MRTYCYNLDYEQFGVPGTLMTIAETIPCFIWEENEETYIQCREEDATFVEEMLSKFV